MPGDPSTPVSQDFNPADFLAQLGIALTIMGQRDPAKATQLSMGLQEMQRRRQRVTLSQQKMQQEQAAGVQDQRGMQTLGDMIKGAMATRIGEGAPSTGTEGLRPVEQTGFGQPKAFQQVPQQLDPAKLFQLMAQSPSAAKMFQDPQTQTYWQSLGLVPPTPQTLVSQQNAETSQHRAGIAEQIAGIRQQLADTSQQNADTSAGRLELSKQIQSLETLMSQLQGANVQARTANLGAKTDQTLSLTPSRVQQSEELVKAMQARYPTIAPMEQAKLEGQQGINAERRQLAPGKFEGQKLTNEGKRKRNAIIGTKKEGKPAESDKRVAAWVENYQYGEDFADIPESEGLAPGLGITYGSTPAFSRREAAAADVKAEVNPAMRDIKLRAFQEVFGGDGGSMAPARSGAAPSQAPTATGPGGQKLILRNGQWVPLGR